MRAFSRLHLRLSARSNPIHHHPLLRLHKHYQMLFKNSWLSTPQGPLNNSLQPVFTREQYHLEEIHLQWNQYEPSQTTSTSILLNLPQLTLTSRNLLVNSSPKKTQRPSLSIQVIAKQLKIIFIITNLTVPSKISRISIKVLSVLASLKWPRKRNRR